MVNHYINSRVTFAIQTPDYEGKFEQEPYKVYFVAVHFVERDRVGNDSLLQVASFRAHDWEAVAPGRHQIVWDTKGMRAGDYFISWKWQPNEGGKSLYAYEKFFLRSGIIPGIPGKEAQRDKYDVLMDLYLPETYKNKIFDNDLTPHVLRGLNKAAADGFLMLEDLGGKVIDLLDANTTHQSVLPLLGNLFNLKLKSDDVTRWRRQIATAIPLFKRKGTYAGLEEALSQAGIKLRKLTILWQVTPLHTWTDAWVVGDENDLEFPLSKVPCRTDFELFLRPAGEAKYLKVPSTLGLVGGPKHALAWVGHTQPEHIPLFRGDRLRIFYQHKEMNPAELEIETYLNRLPLADSRDEALQNYPLKNWNARLIEEDDPMFSVLVAERHPFREPLVFGQVQSIFSYSEKVYNMDAYNGSLRDSTDPADMDKLFLDNCNCGRTSKFNVDVEIEGLSNDRILEAKDIVEEFSPFHAVLHSLNISGVVNEYLLPPIERIRVEVERRSEQKIVFDPVPGPSQADVIEVKENISCVVHRRDGTSEKKEIK